MVAFNSKFSLVIVSWCDCSQDNDFPRPLKRSTGIPNSFMKVVEDLNQPGVMLTSSGKLAVPTIDAYVY